MVLLKYFSSQLTKDRMKGFSADGRPISAEDAFKSDWDTVLYGDSYVSDIFSDLHEDAFDGSGFDYDNEGWFWRCTKAGVFTAMASGFAKLSDAKWVTNWLLLAGVTVDQHTPSHIVTNILNALPEVHAMVSFTHDTRSHVNRILRITYHFKPELPPRNAKKGFLRGFFSVPENDSEIFDILIASHKRPSRALDFVHDALSNESYNRKGR